MKFRLEEDAARARLALAAIPVPSDRGAWIKIGMAAHAAGLTLKDFDEWSAVGSNYDKAAVHTNWNSFHDKPGGIGPGTLFKAASEHGFRSGTSGVVLGRAEVASRAAEQARPAAADAERHAAAAAHARSIWDAADPADSHPYLKRKGVDSYGLRVGSREYVDYSSGEVVAVPNCLLVPMYDRKKKLHSLQFIDASPVKPKRYLKGGAKRGHFLPIGKPIMHAGKPVFVLAEGYATGACVHKCSGHLVLVCFDASNLQAVGLAVREGAPDAIILIAADNDLWNRNEDGAKYNPGLDAAAKAAGAVGGLVAFPPFVDADAWGVDAKGNKTGPTDFNDWHMINGPESVAEILAEALAAMPEKAALEATVAELDGNANVPALEDFWAHLPSHQFIYVPTRDLWPAASVDGHVSEWPMHAETLNLVKPSKWLDRYRAVQQMSWHPGRPMIIENEVVSSGGWSPSAGARVFNLYREPVRKAGDAAKVAPWLDHLRRLYPDDWEHIQLWLAHRIQNPGEKINHALVLGGNPGVGKDTLLEPIKMGVGAWNWSEVSPHQITGSQFNPWVQCVVARVSELRDLKEDRYSFYETMKVYIAAPPDSLAVNQKHIREFYVPNVMGVLFTTNNRTDGLYLPADDRRHFVAWSELQKEDFPENYWTELWGWIHSGGAWHVVEYLRSLSLESFNPTAPPLKTGAFWAIVHANNAPEDAELSGILGEGTGLGAIVLSDVIEKAKASNMHELANELGDRKMRRAIPHKLARVGYVPVHNPDARDGLWVIEGRRSSVYAAKGLSTSDQIRAARSRAVLVPRPI